MTIYAIPGLGTTHELFRNLSIPGHEIKVLTWPEAKGHKTLAEFARAFISQIDVSSPFVLAGVSFGGMLCIELAAVLNPRKTILISSCKNRKEFPPPLRFLRRARLYKLYSDDGLRKLAKKLRAYLGFRKEDEQLFFQMIDAMSPSYFTHCIPLIINWTREKNDVANLIHLHGTKDLVLPHLHIRNYIPVKNGSHAMVLYEHASINSILSRELHGL